MGIYLMNPIITFVLIGLGKKLYKEKTDTKTKLIYKLFIIISFLITWGIMAFRTVGADRSNYISHYKLVSSFSNIGDAINSFDFEFGYNILVYVCTRVSSSPILIFIVTSFL